MMQMVEFKENKVKYQKIRDLWSSFNLESS